MKLSERIFARCFNNLKSFPRFFVGIIFLVLITVTTGYSQSTFNDMWADDSNVDANGNGLVVVGRGVSEINYVDEDGVEVETRITSPSGRTVMSGAFGEVSAQSDARLSFDWEDIGDFTVRVERFPMCNNGGGWNGGDEGILITHGYNGGGGIWWRPTGFQRCPRNSFVSSGIFPVRIARDAYEVVSETFVGGRFGNGVCDYDATCYGFCSLTSFGVDKLTPQNCPRYTQCRTIVIRGTCLNIAKICVASATRGICSS